MATSVPAEGSQPTAFAQTANRIADWLIGHWLLVALLMLGVWNLLPWLAPVFMHLGWELPGRGIYWLYVFFCHQLPTRSWFLFGPQFTYSRDAVLLAATGATDLVTPVTLRAFIGNSAMGWKLAWTDRMISFYGGWLLVGLVYAVLRPAWRGLTLKIAILLMLPLLIDGLTHMLSDLGGLRWGFRETNAWLALLTHSAFAPDFYNGDQWGSFNSLARLVTGLLAAIGLIGFAFPYIDRKLQIIRPPEH